MRQKILLVILLAGLFGCSQKVNFASVADRLQMIAVYTNSNPDKIEWQGPVAVYQKGDAVMTQFVTWLAASTDWKPDFQSYQIPSMMVESDSFALFFFGNYVNLVVGNELYSKKLEESDFDYLLPKQDE